MKLDIILAIAGMIALSALLRASDEPPVLRVPAFTAYAEPDCQAVKFSERNGAFGWKDAKEKIVWYGNIKSKGTLNAALSIKLAAGQTSKLRLTIAEKTLTADVSGKGADEQTVQFGSVEIPASGYYSFQLEGVEKDGKTFGEPAALLLSGPAAESAQFNLKSRRNAASVHLGYPTPKDTKIECFYNEVTVRTDPVWSYYMACGFTRGYFGIQVVSPTERHIIFSIWDSGSEKVSRSSVKDEDRVQLLKKGEGVVTRDFGNEGTGGHSHLVYNWETGKTYRFLVKVKPDGDHTEYSGYFYFPEKQSWGLIATFRAPKDGSYLGGLYSFNEDFVGDNGNKRRLCEFGNQWIKSTDGQWSELLTAKFSHDPTGKNDRHDYAAGVTDGRFYLSNGGFVGEPVKYGDAFTRPATGKPPTDINLDN